MAMNAKKRPNRRRQLRRRRSLKMEPLEHRTLLAAAQPSPLGDLTNDTFVDFDDLTIQLAHWDQSVGPERGNLVDPATTRVDFDDLSLLLSQWTVPKAAETSFVIDAQNPVRNSPQTGLGTVDRQDGAYVNLADSIGGFMWRVGVLPTVAGRNSLTPNWTLYTNSRAHSIGGLFGTTPATLESFERIRRGPSGELIYQEKEVREFVFNLRPISGTPAGGDPRSPEGATARARYEVLKETDTAITMRRPDGTRLEFFPLDGSPAAGALKTIRNRFGDAITHQYNDSGQLETVTDVYARTWNFSYDALGRVVEIREDKTALPGRYVGFSYDDHNRLCRIDTTPVVNDGGIGNTFPEGKPFVITYPEPIGELAHDTNIVSIIYPNEVLSGVDMPAARITNWYGADDRLERQQWGGTNASGVSAGGEVNYTYGDSTTTVVDRNGNQTTYTFNNHGLVAEIDELTNRGIRRDDDPASYRTVLQYNDDEELTRLTRPLENEVRYSFDVGNENRYAHGNVLEVRQTADATRGGDGTGTAIADIVHTFRYEPIFQSRRLATQARGNDAAFAPPIPDEEANVQDLDFNLDGDVNDVNDGETLRARRYTTYTILDYFEGSSDDILALASNEGVHVTPAQAGALSLGIDLNQDGLSQQVGRPIEVRAPNVTLEDIAAPAQQIRTTLQFNEFGQLVAEIDAEGYVDRYTYYPEDAPAGAVRPARRNAGAAGLSPVTGGYLRTVTRDVETLIRTPIDTAPRTRAATHYEYDLVGNLIQTRDPRGVVHTRTINEWNQVQVNVQAADTSDLNPEEPRRPLAALRYETRTHYDANNNVDRVEVENVVDQGAGNHLRVADNPWLDTSFVYDLLDNRVEVTQEVSAGESRTIRGHVLSVGPEESITTRYRYDRNENLVLVLSPLAAVAVADATIESVTNQRTFTLSAGSDTDDAYNGYTVVVTDSDTGTEEDAGQVVGYEASNRTITLESAPAHLYDRCW